jgi:hypothetical protein
MKKIEEEREKMIQQMSVGGQQIMMQNDKGEQVPLSPQQVIQVLNDLQNQIKFLTDKLNESQQIIMEKDTLIRNLQRDVMSSGAINTPNATGELLKKEESISELHIEKIRLELDAEEDAKCEPVIMINIAD